MCGVAFTLLTIVPDDKYLFFNFLLTPYFSYQEEKMYRTTRSPMMQPLVNSGMGMAPFFKVNIPFYDSKVDTIDSSVHVWWMLSCKGGQIIMLNVVCLCR